ncbi:MAG: 4-phosphopantetheinyl transferase family protein [Chitinophagaceae bacterium]|nr:MAG: 4-phosphopantetheinyl transferase family protein [Chitinophagaceae bacterium]
MLGNDIVDLCKAKADSNWQRNGYLAKIFNVEERAQILASPNANLMVWTLWSMKEATYKIINRELSKRFYSPRKFTCKSNGTEGIVAFEGRIFYTRSEIGDHSVHTIACTEKQNLALIQTYYGKNNSSYLHDFYAKFESYSIEKNSHGQPYLVDKEHGATYAISISHHGLYVAIVFPHYLLSPKHDTNPFPSSKIFRLN